MPKIFSLPSAGVAHLPTSAQLFSIVSLSAIVLFSFSKGCLVSGFGSLGYHSVGGKRAHRFEETAVPIRRYSVCKRYIDHGS